MNSNQIEINVKQNKTIRNEKSVIFLKYIFLRDTFNGLDMVRSTK